MKKFKIAEKDKDKKDRVQLGVRIPRDLYNRFVEFCDESNISQSRMILEMILYCMNRGK